LKYRLGQVEGGKQKAGPRCSATLNYEENNHNTLNLALSSIIHKAKKKREEGKQILWCIIFKIIMNHV
jgi:hypothetical protein